MQAHRSCESSGSYQPKTQGFLLKSSLNIEEVDVLSEPEKDASSSCFDLSLEDFPLLPSCKKAIASANHQSVDTTTESPVASKSSPCSKSLEFGTFGLSSSVEGKHPDYDNSATVDSMLNVLTIATQEPSNLSEPDKET